MQKHMTVAQPFAPSAEILADGRYLLKAMHRTGEVLVVFDPQRHVGGAYHLQQGLWRMQCPVELHEFLTGLQANGFVLPDGADLQTWLDAVAQLSGAQPN